MNSSIPHGEACFWLGRPLIGHGQHPFFPSFSQICQGFLERPISYAEKEISLAQPSPDSCWLQCLNTIAWPILIKSGCNLGLSRLTSTYKPAFVVLHNLCRRGGGYFDLIFLDSFSFLCSSSVEFFLWRHQTVSTADSKTEKKWSLDLHKSETG